MATKKIYEDCDGLKMIFAKFKMGIKGAELTLTLNSLS